MRGQARSIPLALAAGGGGGGGRDSNPAARAPRVAVCGAGGPLGGPEALLVLDVGRVGRDLGVALGHEPFVEHGTAPGPVQPDTAQEVTVAVGCGNVFF